MHGVFRETHYAPENPVHETPEFQKFQDVHAEQPGYHGTVVVDVGDGRFLTLTLWDTAESMDAARKAVGPPVQSLLDPMMTAPSELLGTGLVVVDDLDQFHMPPISS